MTQNINVLYISYMHLYIVDMNIDINVISNYHCRFLQRIKKLNKIRTNKITQ